MIGAFRVDIEVASLPIGGPKFGKSIGLLFFLPMSEPAHEGRPA